MDRGNSASDWGWGPNLRIAGWLRPENTPKGSIQAECGMREAMAGVPGWADWSRYNGPDQVGVKERVSTGQEREARMKTRGPGRERRQSQEKGNFPCLE